MRVLIADFTPAPFQVSNTLNGQLYQPGDSVEVATRAALHAGGPYARAASRVTARLFPQALEVTTPAAAGFEFASIDPPGDCSSRDEPDVSIVGLWRIEFRLANGDLYDEGFEQWHSDGTELTLDNAIAPAFGNICLGVWKKTGARSVKLTHVGWNWDVNQKPAGQFWLWMTATVDRRGRVFTGEFRTDSFDLDGNVIPELHAEGTAP